jgi:hypothetical protein
MMMSRYSEGKDFSYDETNLPESSPRGRRYILKNLNTKKLRELNHLDTSRKIHNGYTDIGTAPSSVASISTNSSSKPVGTSNKVMPTDSVSKGSSPRKTPRAPPVYVAPRKDVNANETKKKENKKSDDKKSPRKGEPESKTTRRIHGK